MRLHALARSGEVNLSRNPTFFEMSASELAHETNDRHVLITGINIHDENLNVIMKSRFSQAVTKRDGDKILFRLKYDF